MTPCPIEDCDEPVHCRGMCKPHYMRWRRYGKAEGLQRRPRTPMDNVDKGGPNGCWLWTGPCNKKGYGQAWLKGQQFVAHRWVYEQLVGPIPEGLQLDHLCRVKACVNPDHLEPVTGRVNLRRAHGFTDEDDPDACFRGHDLTSPDSYYTLTDGHRQCRQCARDRYRRRRRDHAEHPTGT